MPSYDDCTLSSSRNAFSPSFLPSFLLSFLHRISQRDEPPTAGEADVAGPWRILEMPGQRFGVFRLGESPERGHRPAAVFRERWIALLAAAVLPGTGRDAAFRLHKEAGPDGYAIETGNGGELAGHSELFDERLIEALHVVACLVRSPEALANVLEAAGPLALDRAGAVLDERV
jgi:hypothetical protein